MVFVFIYFTVVLGDTTKVATGSADRTLRIWDAQTGKCLNVLDTPTSVRSVLFSYSGKLLLYTTDLILKKQPEINVIDLTSGEHMSGASSLFSVQDMEHTKSFSTLWGALDESFITGHESGNIIKWDLRKPGEIVNEVHVHKNQINDLQYNKDQTMFISASKDKTAKVGVSKLKQIAFYNCVCLLFCSFLMLTHWNT